jgi:hypothetical protein
MRGLIEKTSNPADARSFLYQTTTEFLMHLGLTSVSDLPEFAKLVEHIKLPQTPGLTERPSNPEIIAKTPAEAEEDQTKNAEPQTNGPAVLQDSANEDVAQDPNVKDAL